MGDSIHITDSDMVLDGQPDYVIGRRSSIKLASKPQIMVAIPIGGKAHDSVLQCPGCEKSYKVDTGFVVPASVPAIFFLSHMNWVPPLNVAMSYAIKTGLRSAAARQIMTMEAIRADAKYIFYVDDDTIIPRLGLYTLHNFMEQHPEVGAVTGIYTTRETPCEPLLYKNHGEGAAWDIEMGPGARPTQIMGGGAGCLLARVEAIKAWMDANPGQPIWADQRDIPAVDTDASKPLVMWGHDIRFCVLLTELGWPVYAHGQVLCGHYDVDTNQVFEVPADAPGFSIRNAAPKE